MQYKYILNSIFGNFKNALLNIKDIFHQSNVSIHKARNELKIIKINGINCVVKSFKVPNIINQFAYSYLRDSKAKKSYLHALKIDKFTPQPIGYIEFYSKGLLKESYFISEEFTYDFTIREPLLDNNFAHREDIFKAFARFTLELHDNNIFHNDYSPGNILIKKNLNGNYIFKIVDINRMKFSTLSSLDRAKNFSKLWASKEILITMAKEYLQYYKEDKNFLQNVLYYSEKNKKIKNFKKRLKGKEVND